ncbi:GAF domain-like protein [Artemisia annua]|uniref:GAF domain-like protein n=1 Tax=Artemisia annua TaxID=35608 RepID=A0A2U1QNG5_ARTAN|nr:GAF domain-like protein [Artemisia annua]
MDYVSGDSEVDFYDNYEYVQAPTPEFPKISKLKVFYYNHVPRPPTTTNDVLCQRICIALSAISFHDQFVFAQFWAAIEFGSCTVLTTRGQPFGVSVYTKEFWSYRIACLDYNSYVYHKGNEKKVCIGPPARVFLTCSPEWTKDVILYNDKVYPQRLDGLLSKIRGSLAMAVIEAISFVDQFVFAQFWAAIEFGSCTVLTTRGPPARVFLTRSPEWTQDVSSYNHKAYPQRSDALISKIRGSLAMAVIEGDRCKGVVEIVMTNYKDNFLHEMHQVCKALEVSYFLFGPRSSVHMCVE